MQSVRTAFVNSPQGAQFGRLRDRADAGRQLAQKLMAYADRPDVSVLGLARGGVPVAYEIAKALHVPLDVFIARKLGAPGYGELAMGALASGGVRVLNQDVVRGLAISDDAIAAVIAQEQCELERRERTYRGNRPPLAIHNKLVILVDDGIATGATLRAAVAALRTQAPAKLIVAVGVAPLETCETLEKEVDELVSLIRPDRFWAVGQWFADFAPTTDGEVRALLAAAAMHQPAPTIDTPIIQMNEQALSALPAKAKLAIVPDATHLFEEPGALEQVAELACAWFLRHLGAD